MTTINLALSTCTFPPLTEFGNATTGIAPALVLLLRGGRGGGSRGSGGVKKVSPLIAQLGSRFFFVDAMFLLAHIKSHPKSMAHPPCKYLRRLNRVWGTRWCPQNRLGLVARGCYSYFYGHEIRVPIQTLTNKEIVTFLRG